MKGTQTKRLAFVHAYIAPDRKEFLHVPRLLIRLESLLKGPSMVADNACHGCFIAPEKNGKTDVRI
jgi:hypothetical protein